MSVPVESPTSRQPEPAPRRVRRVTSVAGFQIHSLELGGDAEPLVLVHGLSGSSRWWERSAPGLAERYRVLVPDLIGFGNSRCPPARLPSISTLAELLTQWMDELELERANVVGHSMGGQLCVHLAARFPERVDRLVLVDSAGIPRPLAPREVVRFAWEIAPIWRWGDPRFLPVIVGDALTAGPRTLLRAIGHLLRDDVRPLLGEIRAPTLIVWGERDTWVPLSDAWEMRQRIPDSQLAVLRGTAHNPMVDRPTDFNRLVLRFLDGDTVGR